jgi:hypothetical protein
MSAILRLCNGGSSSTHRISLNVGGMPPLFDSTPLAPGATRDYTGLNPAGAQANAMLDDGSMATTGPLSLVDGDAPTEATLSPR